MGEGFDPLGRRHGGTPSSGPGKNFSRSVTHERKAASLPRQAAGHHTESSSADRTDFVKWLTILAGLVLLIIPAVKLL